MTDARSLIMGTSSPAMAFDYPGARIVGRITTEPKAVQQTVYDPKNPAAKLPAFWPSGDPKMQVVFQVETAWRNYEGIKMPDRTRPDNGVRTIYLKGKHMEKATADAIRAVGADWLEVGGMVSFEYTGDDMNSMAGIKPKLFAVRYKSPDARPQQPPQHFGGQQGYPNQGYQAQQPPRPPEPYQYTGPQPPNPAQAYAAYQAQQVRNQSLSMAPSDNGGGNPNSDPWSTPTPVAPPHHGTENSMPDWAAAPTSAPPAPTSAPPSLSTLDMIKQAGQSDPSSFGSVEPAF